MEILDQYLPEHGVIVDLGCGYGIFSYQVSASCPGRTVMGVDLSANRIAAARNVTDRGGSLKFNTGDIKEFNLPYCNAVIMIDVLYMFTSQDQERILSQCYEKLSEDGVLVIKDNGKSPYWKYAYSYIEEAIKVKLGIYGREVRNHSSQFLDAQDFSRLLGRIGFCATMIPLKSFLPYPGVFYICRKGTKAC